MTEKAIRMLERNHALNLKLNALRQRHFRTVVDGVGLALYGQLQVMRDDWS